MGPGGEKKAGAGGAAGGAASGAEAAEDSAASVATRDGKHDTKYSERYTQQNKKPYTWHNLYTSRGSGEITLPQGISTPHPKAQNQDTNRGPDML